MKTTTLTENDRFSLVFVLNRSIKDAWPHRTSPTFRAKIREHVALIRKLDPVPLPREMRITARRYLASLGMPTADWKHERGAKLVPCIRVRLTPSL